MLTFLELERDQWAGPALNDYGIAPIFWILSILSFWTPYHGSPNLCRQKIIFIINETNITRGRIDGNDCWGEFIMPES